MTDAKSPTVASSLPSAALRVARDYLRPYAGKMAIAVVAALAVAGSTSLIAYLMKPAVNDVLRNPTRAAVVTIAFVIE